MSVSVIFIIKSIYFLPDKPNIPSSPKAPSKAKSAVAATASTALWSDPTESPLFPTLWLECDGS